MDGSQKHELESIAREAMRAHGLEPDFSAAAREQLSHIAVPRRELDS